MRGLVRGAAAWGMAWGVMLVLSLPAGANKAIATPVAAETSYATQIAQWRAARQARLAAPDGWLSLLGLDWLHVGDNTIGHAHNNAIVLPRGPARLGVVHLTKEGQVTIHLTAGAAAYINGQALTQAALVADNDPRRAPSVVSLRSLSFYVIARGERYGLRIRDSNAPSRRHFQGLDYFPTDPDWRIQASWIPFKPPRQIAIGSVIGTVDKVAVPGEAVFIYQGKRYALYPIQEDPNSLFFIVADATSGHETYGAARFLSTPLPKNGKLALDFNRLVNPPCAFTPYATCPLPPKQNRLPLRITAGEKKYRGGH